MRRQSTLEQQYDIDIEDGSTQTPMHDSDDVDRLPDSRACFSINNHAVHRWDPVGSDDVNKQEEEEETNHAAYAPWNSPQDRSYDPASISVRMSILRELCAGHDERQNLTSSGLLWRRFAHAEDQDSPMATCQSPTPSDAGSGNGNGNAADPETDPMEHEREHEERRIAERFASFGRPNTPKNRRRNKRKGTDSPRQIAEAPAQPVSCREESPPKNHGQGCAGRQQPLSFDLAQLHDHTADEPVTSHGMRPARGWASFDLLPDDEEDVTVSPRVLSPEMDEPAGSFHAQRFAGCDPPERRTTFIALGGLRMPNRSSRSVLEPNEHPATQRAKQLVQQIYSLKEKVKLYEDAFEQRYGYRPSHHQKMDDRNTKRILTELARTRKELKQLKERYHISDVDAFEGSGDGSASGGCGGLDGEPRQERSFLSSPFNNKSTSASASTASVEQTVLEIQEHLAGNRKLAGRPEAVEELNSQEILDEKLAVQRALLYVESVHGRPASFRHKDLLRPLYDRYRILKRMVVRSGLSRSKEEVSDLAPILEYETLELSHTRPGGLHRHSAPPTPSLESMEAMDDPTPHFSVARRHITTPITGIELRTESSLAWGDGDHHELADSKDLIVWKRQKISLNIEENLHALPLNQLVEQLRHVREEKRRLRRTIRDSEADMLRKGASTFSSSSMTAGQGDGHMEPIYAQYRHARAKLRLLEALVAKHDGSATL
jgi:hypothetical protein